MESPYEARMRLSVTNNTHLQPISQSFLDGLLVKFSLSTGMAFFNALETSCYGMCKAYFGILNRLGVT